MVAVEHDNTKLWDDSERQWTAIDKLKNRPPVWATIVLSVIMFLLGVTMPYAIGNLADAHAGPVTMERK